jgi:hypothetical protein
MVNFFPYFFLMYNHEIFSIYHSEDGRSKTALDIFLNFQQLGYISAPFIVCYSTIEHSVTRAPTRNVKKDLTQFRKSRKRQIT